MVQKQFCVDLDIKRSTSNRDFEVVDGDNGNTLVVTLTDEGQPVKLTDCYVIAVFSKSDGRTAAQDNKGNGITLDPAQPNRLDITLYRTSFAPGLVECELQVYSGEGERVLVTCAKFNFMCRRGIANASTIPETDEWPILVEMLDRVETVEDGLAALNEDAAQAAATAHTAASRANAAAEYAQLINADMETAEAQRKLNELTRIGKEGERQTAEAARAQAEAARNATEAARAAAESARTQAEAARAQAETSRSSAESTRLEAEAMRLQAEAGRAQSEHDRRIAEAARSAEQDVWAADEAGRRTAEAARGGAEAERAQSEAAREASESLRAVAEAERDAAETARRSADALRAQEEETHRLSEQARADAEQGRLQAELSRAQRDLAFHLWEEYDTARNYAVFNKVAHNGSSYLCIAPAQGVAPPNPQYWLMIAAKGADGAGAGDMLRAAYDTDGSGVVDDAERLGGRPASAYLIQETDPTVPDWAKQPTKPAYTATETGAAPADHAHGGLTSGGAIGAVAGRAVYTGADGALEAGTLAIAAGGTGAVTAEAARAAIGAARPSRFHTATLKAGGWSPAEPYVQTLAVADMDENVNALFDLSRTATDAQFEAGKAAALTAHAQGAGTLTVRARGELPDTDIQLDILIVG